MAVPEGSGPSINVAAESQEATTIGAIRRLIVTNTSDRGSFNEDAQHCGNYDDYESLSMLGMSGKKIKQPDLAQKDSSA